MCIYSKIYIISIFSGTLNSKLDFTINLVKRQILLCKTNPLEFKQNCIWSKSLSFWLTTYLLCFEHVLCNRQSPFIWIFVMFWTRALQLTVAIHMDTNCAPRRFVSLFAWSKLNVRVSKEKRKKLAPPINLMFRYIDDVFSLNNYEHRVCWLCWSHLSHWTWNKGCNNWPV